jgi:chromosome segregation protein
MRIRRIELQGFKSFVDKTVFQLAPGICSIVGPNGAGKSNIIDAIKWTLGEQSASTLRGRAMEDVIFAGSEGRPPASRAEVTLVFDNADGAFGGRYARFDEVQVSRQLDRAGRSDYAINKTSARLKDVVDLFLDSGVGARGYSIIEQGRVGFVVNSRSDERRVLIDEVAGINRFKAQRAESERRMHRTRENLVRVRDLLGEMGRQRTGLQRAAKKALRYRELRSAWKAASLRALAGQALQEAGRLHAGQRAMDQADAAEAELVASVEAARTGLSEHEAGARSVRDDHEALTERRAELTGRLTLRRREHQFRGEEQRGLSGRLERIAADVDEMTARAAAAREGAERARTELTRAREELTRLEAAVGDAGEEEGTQRDAARSRRREVEALKAKGLEARTAAARATGLAGLLARQIDQAVASLAEHDQQAQDRAARTEELARRLESARAVALERAADWARAQEESAAAALASTAARDAEQAVRRSRDAARTALQQRRARLTSIQELLDGLAGFGDGVRAFLAAHAGTPDVLGPVAELLRVPGPLEGAVEAALGSLLQGIVVRAEALPALADWVEAEGLERIALVVPDPARPAAGLAASVESDVPGLAAVLLGGVDLGDGPRSVTPSGRLRDGGVLWVGRHTGAGEGVLARRREAAALAEAVAVDEATLAAREAEVRAAADAAAAAVRAAEAARADVHARELRALEGRRDQDDATSSLARAEREAEHAAAARANLERQRAAWEEEAAEARTRAAAFDREGEALEARAGALRDGLADAERQVSDAASRANALRVEHASLQQVAAGRLRDLRRLEAESTDLERRLARADADRSGVAARHAQLDLDLARLATEAVELEGELSSLADQLADADARKAAIDRDQQAAEAAVAALRRDLDQARQGRTKREVALAEARATLQALADRAAAEFDVALGPLLQALTSDAPATVELHADGPLTLEPADLDPSALAAHAREAASHARALEDIGPVNLAAPAEFDEVDARYQELQAQNDDLEKALGDLQRAIARIEKETRDRFVAAFDAVAERFAALYPRLVGGGRAELRMTEPDKPLETGVDVVVEPPGKRLQNLTLLSGGEKAMAAIALVFALFQVKPSPFCLLDEVDAPLDEANSRRFNDTLREMAAETQFVVITHNRTTMEVADVLYGVTMQRPGVSSLVSVQLDDLPEDD